MISRFCPKKRGKCAFSQFVISHPDKFRHIFRSINPHFPNLHLHNSQHKFSDFLSFYHPTTIFANLEGDSRAKFESISLQSCFEIQKHRLLCAQYFVPSTNLTLSLQQVVSGPVFWLCQYSFAIDNYWWVSFVGRRRALFHSLLLSLQ